MFNNNQVILRSFKEIRKKNLKINIEKKYEDDNYLTQTLKRTTKAKYDKKMLYHQYNLKKLLSYIYKKIQLENDPEIKIIKEENDDFKKDYKYFLIENLHKSIETIFKDLIRIYYHKGYKIPKLTHEHNIFKINSLIEENKEKIKLIKNEDNKKKNPMIADKTMIYLKKLKYLINLFLNKDEIELKNMTNFSLPKMEKSIKNNETIKEIKKSIEKLKLLIGKNPIINFDRRRSIIFPERKLTRLNTNNFKIINLKNSNKNYNNINTNSNSINKIQKSLVLTESSYIYSDRKNEISNFLSIRSQSNESSQSNKSINSQKDEINAANKRKKEEILFFSKSDNIRNILSRNSKELINLKKMKNYMMLNL